MKKTKKILLFLLFILSGFLYYLIFVYEAESSEFKKEEVFIKRILDGDTFELLDGRKIRLLGINTPEKGKFMSNYSLSLSKELENKSVFIFYKKKDKYGRILAYLFYEGENFNKKLLQSGLAHLYYYEKDFFYDEMKKTEKNARIEKKGIWKDSENKNCVFLIKFDYKEKKRCNNEEILILENKCDRELSVLIKDDSTKQFEEKIKKGTFSKNFSCTFNDEGDSVYLWDNSGLILFHRYP